MARTFPPSVCVGNKWQSGQPTLEAVSFQMSPVVTRVLWLAGLAASQTEAASLGWGLSGS